MNAVNHHGEITTATHGRLRIPASRVHAVVIRLSLWLALAVWGFVGHVVTDYLLVIIS
jgi:hypothetical protein